MVYQNRQKLNEKKPNGSPGWFALMAALFVSCATPKPADFYAGRAGFALMAEGADLYISAEVQAVRPILDNLLLGGMTGAELKDFLDMTSTLTAAVFEGESPGGENAGNSGSAGSGNANGGRFYAAARGQFPSARGGLFFSASKDWKKKTSASGIDYWHSDKSKLSVFLDGRNAYLASGDPFVPPPGAREPDALRSLREGAVLSGWMKDPAGAINRIIAAFGVPIEIPAQRLVFAVYPAETEKGGTVKPGETGGRYTAILRFETAAAAQANALARIFGLARIGLALADFGEYKDMETLARAFFAEAPRTEGNALILKTAVMSGRDLALLFNTISVY